MRRALFDALSLGLAGGALALTFALYPSRPPLLATHFDTRGVPNGWMTRAVGAWVLPAVGLATWALLRFAPRIFPRAWAACAVALPMAFLVVALFCAIQVILLYAARHPGEAMGRPILLALGAFWLASGQVMPRLRCNPVLGIRTAWTLTSDENWLRTHRVAAYAFSAAGAFALAAGGIGGGALAAAAISAFVVSAVAPAVYSFVLGRRLPPAA